MQLLKSSLANDTSAQNDPIKSKTNSQTQQVQLQNKLSTTVTIASLSELKADEQYYIMYPATIAEAYNDKEENSPSRI